MQAIKAYTQIFNDFDGQNVLKKLELIGRTCYKSQDKITEDSAAKFVAGLIKRNHEAMLEHVSITVKFVTDRGISHEIVRHRVASFAQESTRYCNYSQDKFGNELTFIVPEFLDYGSEGFKLWKEEMKNAEKAYFAMLKAGHAQLHRGRQKLIKPVEETWEQKYESWKNLNYEGKAFEEGASLILTERGERVRSKSEKILADFFYHNGIEYKYEKPLILKGVGTVYPDFTFLSRKTGKEIYWEHDGRMDDPLYSKAAVRKINTYIKNEILPGDRLILTYETAATPLQMECVKTLVRFYLQ